MYRKFLGSTIALACGIFFLFAIGSPRPDGLDTFLTGLVFILGALTYKSAKKRKLGIVRDSKYRKYLEAAGLTIVFLLSFLPKNHLWAFIFLVWIVSSYAIIVTREIQPAPPQN